MRNPKKLLYSKSHEWIDMHEDGTTYIGLTDYAQKALGDIVFVNLPEEGDEVTCGESFADAFHFPSGTLHFNHTLYN